MLAHPLCICIGFTDTNSMHRVFVASLGVVLTFAGVRVALARGSAVASELLLPFESAAAVVGSNMMFLSLLIISSQHYSTKRPRWLATNAAMCVLLLTAQFVGHTYGLVGMANVGTTFTALWLLDKYAEMHIEADWNKWILILMTSLAAWQASLVLHANPAFVASLFAR